MTRGEIRRAIVLLGFVLSASGLPAHPGSPSLSGLEGEFTGREFATRVPIGISYAYYNQDLGRLLRRSVETQIGEDGRIDYVTVGGDLDPDDWQPVASTGVALAIRPEEMRQPIACPWPGQLDKRCRNIAIPPGAKVRLGRWRWGGDNVLLEVSVGLGSPAIRMIFAKDFQGTATRQSIVGVLAQALILENLTGGDKPTESVPDTNQTTKFGPGQGRLPSDLDAGRKPAREAALAKRLQDIDTILKNKDRLIEALLAEGEARKASGSADSREQETRFAQIRRLIEEKAPLFDQRAELGVVASRDEVLQLAQQRQRLATSRGSRVGVLASRDEALQLAQQRQRLATSRGSRETPRPERRGSRLDEQYSALDRKLAAQRDVYTRAFGSPAFETEAGKYLALLQQMYENRLGAGNSSVRAAREAADLRKEIERTRSRLNRTP
jgi:hypothetical protein